MEKQCATTEGKVSRRSLRRQRVRLVYADAETAEAVRAMPEPQAAPVGTCVKMVSRGQGKGASVTLSAQKVKPTTGVVSRQDVSMVRTCLRSAMAHIRRYGTAIPDMGTVRGKDSCAILHNLANGPSGGGVPQTVFDAVQEVMGWALTYVTDAFVLRVVLEWARRTPWSEIEAMDAHGRKRWQLNQLLNLGLESIIDGLKRDDKMKVLAQTTQMLI